MEMVGRVHPGWEGVEVPDTDDVYADVFAAYNALPKDAKDHINKALKKRGASPKEIREVQEDTAGCGLGFTLACENWDEMG